MLRTTTVLLAMAFSSWADARPPDTPPAEAWRAPAFDLSTYFTPDEVRSWREHRQRHRRVHLVALGLDLLTYVLLLGALGRWLWRRGQALGGRLERRLSRGRLDRLLARLFGADWLPSLIFAYLYFAIGVALDLPLGIWQELIARDAGLSTTTAWRWLSDFLVALLVSSVLFTLLVVGLFGLIRRFPRRFWLVLALPVAAVTLLLGLLSPYATRIYNRITPLEQTRFASPELSQRLRTLARSAANVRLAQIKVVDTSLRSRQLGAYLDGFGPTRELVLSDTLLELASPAEIEVVVAHELAHLRHERLWLVYGLTPLGLVGLLWLLGQVLRLGAHRMGLDGPGDVRTLPLLGLCTLLLFNAAQPLRNAYSREQERAADRFALTATGDPDAFISMQVKLARRNRADVHPSRLVELWLFSHPPVAERIAMARWYRSWLERK